MKGLEKNLNKNRMEENIMAYKSQNWICTCCGKKTARSASAGRPDPGRCPRKSGDKPHSWVKN